jgi:glycosyltransferase involved in cell wall biosynthesis
MTVLAKGSVSGVDTGRFRPNPIAREEVRIEIGVGPQDVVALFCGRLTRDKGLLELMAAMRELRNSLPELHVAVLGFEEGNFLTLMRHTAGLAADRLHALGFSPIPERYMAAADFLVLPSHREGFGLTVVEAAACGTPSIGTRIHGLTDAIIDRETGLLVPPRDAKALARSMMELVSDPQLRRRLGSSAMHRVRRDFSAATLRRELQLFYERLLGKPLV